VKLSRRGFGRLALGAAAAFGPGCSEGPQKGRFREADREALAAQRRLEVARDGKGPDGVRRYKGYRGLAKLPWYELSPEGRLRCVAEVPRAIDVHAHLGMSLLLAPDLDLLASPPRVMYELDCDGYEPPLSFDLDVYANGNFTSRELWALRLGALAQLTVGSERAATQTLPNLISEMDACQVERACLLPIAFGLPFGDHLTERWLAAIQVSGAEERVVRAASVHPRDPRRIEKLRHYAAQGCRLLKMHPGAQRFYADCRGAMELYEEAGRLGLVVFFHAGRAGIEPDLAQRYNLARYLDAPLADLPNVTFVLGHAGARDVAQAIPIAKQRSNAWLGIHGQGLQSLRLLLREVDPERLLFGTDWPFYALAASQAKVLIVTEGDPDLRYAILRGNAERLLQLG